eukprot:10513793-Karenia_brevis.AAC.1
MAMAAHPRAFVSGVLDIISKSWAAIGRPTASQVFHGATWDRHGPPWCTAGPPTISQSTAPADVMLFTSISSSMRASVCK